jgi:hypothetical protein
MTRPACAPKSIGSGPGRHYNYGSINVTETSMKGYESDVTRFIREFLAKNPEVVAKQEKARATWWDRPQDFKENAARDAAEVPRKSYEYY